MLNISDSQIIDKIIELQTSIIDGLCLNNVLLNHIDFFLEKSQADIITIYMHEQVKPKYILTKDTNYANLLNKYVFHKKKFEWDKFVKNCNSYFTMDVKYEQVNELYPIFKGYMSKKDAESFTKKMKMKSAIMMPIRTLKDENIIGYIWFIFKTDRKVELKKINEIRQLFRTILRPLYDENYHKTYTKCIKIDEEMSLLTTHEKNISKYVLEGKSYLEIADIFNISINTVKKHMVNIFNKYNVNSKMEFFNKLYMGTSKNH